MQTVAETPTFTRQADKLFGEEERKELIDYLAENPLAGEEIPGTGGVRKLRFGRLGPRQEGRCAGDLLLRRRTNAGLRASRLCEVRQDRFESAGAARNPRFGRRAQEHRKGEKMSTFGEDLIQSLNEAVAHAKGEGPAIVHAPVTPREVRKQAKLTQAQMAPLMGMSLSGYRKWEQGVRRVSGPAATLLRVIQKEPEAVRRALSAT